MNAVHPRRRGQILVLMVPLLLAFFAMAALVIDLGFVRTTRARMTTAADTAALEALRWRDQLPPGVTGLDLDASRRTAAAAIVTDAFSSPDAARPFDAGPLVNVTHAASAGAADAYAVLTPAAVGYQPQLQPNATNAIDGDIVAGRYAGTAPHAESADYSRSDFVADPAGQSPSGLSVLVRLRRTNEAEQPGVLSSGPTLPLLFGRGAAIVAGSGYSVRRDGIAVRATSIATAEPAVYAGPALPNYSIQGAIPIALLRSAWEGVLAAAPQTPVMITIIGPDLFVGSTQVGYSLAASVTTIGSTTVVGAVPATATGYFPIVDDTLAPPRVVGFGWATLDRSAGTLVKLATPGGSVAPWNASSNLRDAWSTLAGLDAGTRAAVLASNAALKDPVLVAASVRSTDVP